MRRVNRILFIFLSLNLCACTSYYPVITETGDIRKEVRAGTVVHVGDRVRLDTGDDQEYELTVTLLTDDVIVGEEGSVNIHDIQDVQIRKVSAIKTTGLVVGAVAILALYAYGKAYGELLDYMFLPATF